MRVAQSYLSPPSSRRPVTSPQRSVLLLSFKRNHSIRHVLPSQDRRTAATAQKRKKTNISEEQEHDNSPGYNALRNKKGRSVSGIKRKEAKQLNQQRPKPAIERTQRSRRQRETDKQDKHQNRAGKNRPRNKRSTSPKVARRAHRLTACTSPLVLHGI